MKMLRIILAIIVAALGSYGLLSGTDGIIMPSLLLVMALMLIVMGINEFKKQKSTSFNLFLAAGFGIFVAIYIY